MYHSLHPSSSIKTFHFPLLCHKTIALKHPKHSTPKIEKNHTKIYNSFVGFSRSHSCMFKSTILLNKKTIPANVAGKKEQKSEVHVVCVCFFYRFSLRQHGLLFYFTFTPLTLHTWRLRVSVSNYFSSPQNSLQQFLPLATTKIFSSFQIRVEWWNLFFASRRSWWNGGSTNCFVFLVRTHTRVDDGEVAYRCYIGSNFLYWFKDADGVSESLNNSPTFRPSFSKAICMLYERKVSNTTMRGGKSCAHLFSSNSWWTSSNLMKMLF